MSRMSIMMMERRGAATIEDAENMLGGEGMLDLAKAAGWLKPCIQAKRKTLFDYDEVLACWKRIREEGYDALKQAAANKPNATEVV